MRTTWTKVGGALAGLWLVGAAMAQDTTTNPLTDLLNQLTANPVGIVLGLIVGIAVLRFLFNFFTD